MMLIDAALGGCGARVVLDAGVAAPGRPHVALDAGAEARRPWAAPGAAAVPRRLARPQGGGAAVLDAWLDGPRSPRLDGPAGRKTGREDISTSRPQAGGRATPGSKAPASPLAPAGSSRSR